MVSLQKVTFESKVVHGFSQVRGLAARQMLGGQGSRGGAEHGAKQLSLTDLMARITSLGMALLALEVCLVALGVYVQPVHFISCFAKIPCPLICCCLCLPPCQDESEMRTFGLRNLQRPTQGWSVSLISRYTCTPLEGVHTSLLARSPSWNHPVVRNTCIQNKGYSR